MKETIRVDEFYFDEIDCPNCANKVEIALNKSEKIIEAQVIFLSKKIKVKHQEKDIYLDVCHIVKSVEKDTNVFRTKEESFKEINNKKEHQENIIRHKYDNKATECTIIAEGKAKKKIKYHKKKNKRVFSEKQALILGSILFFVAIVIQLLGSELVFNLINKEPLLKGLAYLIPLFSVYIISYILLAYDLIYKSIYGIFHKDYFNESLLMVIASLGAIVLSFIGEVELFEACAVVLLYKIGEELQNKAVEKSKGEITKLIDLEVEEVLTIDNKVKSVYQVKVGEELIVKVGEKIPLDGIIISGSSTLDMKSLTGESEPIYVNEGREVLSGGINLGNVITIKVNKEYSDSTISKVKKVVEEANEKKGKTEQFVTKFARIYTPIILFITLVIMIVLLILQRPLIDVLNSVFAILVISCPCSLVISIPLGYFASIGNASKNGMLVKGSNYLEALCNVESVIFDKTGTLTEGEFEVVEVSPIGTNKEELLSIASSIEIYSSHPIAKSICNEVEKVNKIDGEVSEVPGLGLKVVSNGDVFLVGNSKLLEQNSIEFVINDTIGSVVYISKNTEFLGSIVLRDKIKKDAKNTIFALKQMKIATMMLTGDKKEFGEFVSDNLGIDHVESELLPQDKYHIVDKKVENKKNTIVYVGDGINDAPSLKRADVGISFGDIGSGLVKETSDIVVMNKSIYKVVEIIKLSKFTKKVIVSNLVIILISKLLAMFISLSGFLDSYAMLIAIFADVGICLICVFNSLRILKYKQK